jgi:hypothetical protein
VTKVGYPFGRISSRFRYEFDGQARRRLISHVDHVCTVSDASCTMSPFLLRFSCTLCLLNACCPIKDTSWAPQAVNGTVPDPFELVGVGFCDVMGCFDGSSCVSMLLDECNGRLGLNSVTDGDHARN